MVENSDDEDAGHHGTRQLTNEQHDGLLEILDAWTKLKTFILVVRFLRKSLLWGVGFVVTFNLFREQVAELFAPVKVWINEWLNN